MQQTEPSLEDWKINTEKLASLLFSLPYEIDPGVDDELLKRKRKRAIRR